MKHQTTLVMAICLAFILTASATWALATSGVIRGTQDGKLSTNSAILTFVLGGTPNVGDMCANLTGTTYVCGNQTPDWSTPLPRAGELVTMIIKPVANDVATEIAIVVFVNNFPTALHTVIPAKSTDTRLINANVPVAAGDPVKIVAEGFTSPKEYETLYFSGSLVYQYP